jgi:hypothetical protein
MVISIFILIAGISLLVFGGFVKRRFQSFGCLILGCILITYSIVSIVMEIENSKGELQRREQSNDHT